MTEEEKRELLLDAKQFHMAAPILLPLLSRMREDTLSRLTAAYRDGDKDFTNKVGELYVITNLEHEIKTKESYYNEIAKEKR